MKLLLTSAGIKNPSINDAMVDLLGKPIAECDALCIPTASYGHAAARHHGAYRFITGQATTPMVRARVEIPRRARAHRAAHASTGALAPGGPGEPTRCSSNGGDSLYLAHRMRESGLADLLPSLSDRSGSAVSAGSMVMTPRIGEDFKVWNPPGGGDRALGLVDFSIFPHVDHPDLPENTMAAAEKWAAGIGDPAYAIDDDTAIRVVDGTVDVVSEGHWKQFP